MMSCEKETKPTVKDDAPTSVDEGLKALGFNPTTTKKMGDTLIVEGDIILYKSKLLQNLNKTTARQAIAIMGALDKIDVKIAISTAFTSAEVAVIKDVLSEFTIGKRGNYGYNSIT